MAYITKTEVQEKTEALRKLNKEYKVKASFSGSNSLSLTLTIHSGPIDFINNAVHLAISQNKHYAKITLALQQHIDNLLFYKNKGYLTVNHYYLDRSFDGIALEYLEKAYAIMKHGHYDNSDVMTDYFDCAWYNDITIGKWNKPYQLID